MRSPKQLRTEASHVATLFTILLIGCADQTTSLSQTWAVECDDQASLD